MTKEELITLLFNPNQTGQAIDELSSLIEEYPYFHTGHQLYLRGLRQTDEGKMASQLKKTALCVRDRDVLYRYINQSSPQIDIHRIQESAQPKMEKQPLHDNFTSSVDTTDKVAIITPVEIREIYSEQQLVADLMKTAHLKTDQTDTLSQNTPENKETKGKSISPDENRTWSPSELIEFFLKSNPKIVPNDRQYEVDLSESLHDNQEIATELLADIYATQGHKDKAIEIYRQLILKYPEKHIYFAAQIERLKE